MNSPTKHPLTTWVADSGWVTVVMTGITIVAGLVLSEVQNKIGWLHLSIAAVCVFGLYWLTLLTIGRPMLRVMGELRDQIIRERVQGPHQWLFDTHQLAAHEKTVTANEIWLITSDLLDDSQEGAFFEIVEANLAKKTKYVYFSPETPENRSRQESIRALHKGSQFLSFVSLPVNFFMLVPKLDVVIYNPRGHSNGSKSGFMGIPVYGEANHYHAKVSLELIDKIVGTVLPHIKNKRRVGR